MSFHAPVSPASRSLSSSARSQRGSSTSEPRPPIERLVLIVEPVLGELREPLVHAWRSGRSACWSWTSWIACSLPNSLGRLVQRLEHVADLELEMARVEHVLERRTSPARASGGSSGSRDRSRRRPCGRRAAPSSTWPSANWRFAISASFVRELDLAAQDLGELRPRGGRRVQPIEREHGRLVVELDLEELLVRRDRLPTSPSSCSWTRARRE